MCPEHVSPVRTVKPNEAIDKHTDILQGQLSENPDLIADNLGPWLPPSHIQGAPRFTVFHYLDVTRGNDGWEVLPDTFLLTWKGILKAAIGFALASLGCHKEVLQGDP